VQSFTDKTGAPGKLGCIPMTGSIDFTTPANMPKGLATSFEVLQQNLSIPNASAITYTWSAPNFNPNSGTGILYAPAAPANTGTYEVVLTASSTGYCDLETSKTVTVIDCISSAIYDLKVSATAYCTGSSVTFALSNTTLGRTYRLYKGSEAVMNALPGTGGAATFTGAFAGAGTYTAQVTAEGGNCPAVMAGTHTVSENPLPDTPTITASASTVCQGTNVVLMVSSPVAEATYTWSVNPESPAGTASGTDNGTYTVSGATTGTKSASAYASLASSGITCQSVNAATVTAVVATMPTAATVTRVSAATVCQNTNVVFRVSGTAGSTFTWLGTTGTPSGTGSGTLTVSGAATGTKSVSAYARLTSSGTTCQSANAATVTAVVNLQPTITRRSGNASQTVNQGTAITPIIYSTTYSAVISRTGGSFPTNVSGAPSGTPSGTSFTISGTPSVTGTFGYSLTASNGCASTASSGTITVNAAAPQYAASTKTWTVGTQTWSDVIKIPTCNKASYSAGSTTADCRNNGSYGYLYSWTYVQNNASTLCPSPWSVPTSADFCTLDKALFGTSTCASRSTATGYTTYNGSKWGGSFGGNVEGHGILQYQGSDGDYWSRSSASGENAYHLYYHAKLVTPQHADHRGYGFQVRCVK
jgi:uncharacterized protein (TIGR02145 family)